MLRRAIGGWLACLIGGGVLGGSVALAAAPHSVLPAETLQSTSAVASTTTVGAKTSMTTVVPAAGMGHVPSPYGELHLIPAGADVWERDALRGIERLWDRHLPGRPSLGLPQLHPTVRALRRVSRGLRSAREPPGSSSHESGTAVDLETPEIWVIDQIGSKYGWGKVHAPGEWWHVDYLGG
jgi:hypothetical protein